MKRKITMQESRWSRSSDYWFYHIIFSGYTYRPALAPPPPRYQPNPAITYREEPSCTDYCCLACDSEYEWYKLEGKGRPYNPAYNYGNYRTNSETETSSSVFQSLSAGLRAGWGRRFDPWGWTSIHGLKITEQANDYTVTSPVPGSNIVMTRVLVSPARSLL